MVDRNVSFFDAVRHCHTLRQLRVELSAWTVSDRMRRMLDHHMRTCYVQVVLGAEVDPRDLHPDGVAARTLSSAWGIFGPALQLDGPEEEQMRASKHAHLSGYFIAY